MTDCKVSIIVNNVKPYQGVVALGKSGTNDFSNWTFTVTSNYTQLTEGSNKLTSKISCSGSAPNSSKWFSVNVTGVRDIHPLGSNHSSISRAKAMPNKSEILPQATTVAPTEIQPANSTEKTSVLSADAGLDQTVKSGSIVKLNAVQSKDITSYSWIQTSGSPVVALHNAGSPVATFQIHDVKSDSKLTFKLMVVDNDNSSASDTVNVVVNGLKTQNQVSKEDTPCDKMGITNLC